MTILPRPSILTSLVVATSVASGLAFGAIFTAGFLLATQLKAGQMQAGQDRV